jgi:drug/metabolite transporter (DMT)-like permease
MLKDDSPSLPADPTQNFTVEARESVVLKPQSPVMTAVVCIGGLLVPGLGHLLLKRWIRGALLLVSIVLMFFIGLGMDGQLYMPPESGQWISFNTLGCFADVGVGIPYILAVRAGMGGGVPTSQTFDYGWAYLIVAGLLNYLVVLDAFDIAQGRKP